MEGVVQGHGHKRSGPDAVGGINEEATTDTSKTEADEVGAHSDDELVGKRASPALVEHVREELYPDDVVGVWKIGTNLGHDCDKHVFLLGERTRVQTVTRSEQSEALVGKPSCGSNSDGICQELGNVCFDGDGRLSDGEQLVDESEQSNEDQANNVCAKGSARHVGIVGVVDDGSDLGVRRVVDNQGGLDLYLGDELRMLVGVDEDVLVEQELPDLVENAVREVGIELVDLPDFGHHVSCLLESKAICFLSGMDVVISRDVEITGRSSELVSMDIILDPNEQR